MTSSTPLRAKRRPGAMTMAIVAIVAGGIAAVTGLWAVHLWGPQFGIWLVPPSPARYGAEVLKSMDHGLYAEGAKWNVARTNATHQLENATTVQEADTILADALSIAGGKHSRILTDAELTQHSALVGAPSSTTSGGILTVSVPGFMGSAEEAQAYASTLEQALRSSQPCGVIVDVRANSGGDMGPMIAGLSPLIPDGTVATFGLRAGQSTEVTLTDGTITGGGSSVSVPAGPTMDVPLAILQGGDTASSGEQTLLAFRGLPNARSFGQPTAGYASVNQTIPLYSGSTMLLTIGVTQARTGETFGDTPIAPDQETSAEDAPSQALAWLASHGCTAGS